MAKELELNDSDRLLLFLHRLSELRKRTFYPYARACTPETQMHLTPVDEERFMAFLMSFRHFFMEGEPTHMGRIANIVKKHAYDRGDADLMKTAKEADQTFRESKPELEALGEQNQVVGRVTEDEVIDLWLNGRYFHNDFEGLRMLTPGTAPVTGTLKCFLLVCMVRHLQRLEDYEPLVKFLVLHGGLPRGFLRLGTPVNDAR